MLSTGSIWREAHLHFGSDGDARKIPSTSLRAGSSGLKSLRMTPGPGRGCSDASWQC